MENKTTLWIVVGLILMFVGGFFIAYLTKSNEVMTSPNSESNGVIIRGSISEQEGVDKGLSCDGTCYGVCRTSNHNGFMGTCKKDIFSGGCGCEIVVPSNCDEFNLFTNCGGHASY